MIFDKKSAPKNVSCVLWDLILHWQYKIHIQYRFRNKFCPPNLFYFVPATHLWETQVELSIM